MTTTSTPDLVARILAAIEETERIAQAATPGPWEPEGDDPTDDEVYTVHDGEHGDLVGDVVAYVRGYDQQQSNMAHIARQDPKTALRRCAADRRTVERHRRPGSAQAHGTQDGIWVLEWCEGCGAPMPCPDLLDRAAAYNITPEGS